MLLAPPNPMAMLVLSELLTQAPFPLLVVKVTVLLVVTAVVTGIVSGNRDRGRRAVRDHSRHSSCCRHHN